MCALVTKYDLEYWGIDELLLEPCCALRYYPEIELCVKEVEGEENSRRKTKERREAENFGDTRIGKIRKYLWNLTEYPETSKLAQVFNAKFSLETQLFTVAINELLCLKNLGAQISMFFTSNE